VASGSAVLLATVDGVMLDSGVLEVPAGGAAIAGPAL
jgi:maltooligosyltrehalose trehalohydrolase